MSRVKNTNESFHYSTSCIPVTNSENIEVESKIKMTELYKAPIGKSILKWIFYICTAGLGYLACRWFPRLLVSLNFVLCSIDEAEWTAVYGHGTFFSILFLPN